ncbi:hypothetical protein F2Q69_00031059 [Brassica cretica]|uniref:Uncharacterized protein n=1 Tax=Brassica cretica TaxID=69181 RepID=A0A8S9RV82_BRACR|nr:hypothetical protein F2Q69_00031059 [Brassica cretica]
MSSFQTYSRFTKSRREASTEKGQFAPPLPCALTPTPKYCARKLDRPETLCLSPDVFSNSLKQNECDDYMLRLAFEIHLVSLINFDEFRTDRAYFIFKSNQIGLPFLGVAYGSRTSHQNLLVVNNPSVFYWCFNVVFDYQFFCQTIALGIKVKFLHRVLHLAKLDSPLIGYILLCLVMLSIIVVPLSMSPESSAFVVNFYAH